MTAKKYQNPTGGLNDAGRKHYGVKKPVPEGKNPMKKPDGSPTRKALALKKWGFGSVASAKSFANNNKKS